jgi:hypothetical protein
MRLIDLAIIHKQVVHQGLDHSKFCRDYDNAHPEAKKARYFPHKCLVCKEEKWVKKYPYDTLESVCSDCFSSLYQLGDTPIP